jgi:hypothetical protein
MGVSIRTAETTGKSEKFGGKRRDQHQEQLSKQ